MKRSNEQNAAICDMSLSLSVFVTNPDTSVVSILSWLLPSTTRSAQTISRKAVARLHSFRQSRVIVWTCGRRAVRPSVTARATERATDK
eukprot:289804-Prymnesium_polylepis.1